MSISINGVFTGIPITQNAVTGTPQLINTITPVTLFTPPTSRSLRLKWIALASPDTNTTTIIATIKIGSNIIYLWPLSAPGVFSHNSVREGNINETLTITLSAAQDVYVNFDIEIF